MRISLIIMALVVFMLVACAETTTTPTQPVTSTVADDTGIAVADDTGIDITEIDDLENDLNLDDLSDIDSTLDDINW